VVVHIEDMRAGHTPVVVRMEDTRTGHTPVVCIEAPCLLVVGHMANMDFLEVRRTFAALPFLSLDYDEFIMC